MYVVRIACSGASVKVHYVKFGFSTSVLQNNQLHYVYHPHWINTTEPCERQTEHLSEKCLIMSL